MRAVVIWNPSKVKRARLERAFGSAPEVDFVWFETSAEDAGQEVTRQAVADESPDVVIVAGGDGTVRAVAEALAPLEHAPELAILPLGTGNLLARNLQVPLRVNAAAARALKEEAQPIDFGWVEIKRDEEGSSERHGFAVMVGFGIDANMIAETDDDLKARAGWLAYVESLGRALAGSEVLEAEVTIDEKHPREVDAHTIIVGNCGMIQGGITVLPDASPSDGKLDVLVLSASGWGGWLETMKTMVWDKGIRRILPGTSSHEAPEGEHAHFAQATDILVKLPDARPFQIDGEQMDSVREFHITVQRDALRVR